MSNPTGDPFSPLVDDVRSGVLAALGESSVLSMFVTGSVAKDEAVAFNAGSQLEVYSDVDVAVVVGDDVDLRVGRAVARKLATDIELVRDGVLHCCQPDIGIYSRQLYANQPARPGTVGIPGAHQLVFGDPELPRSFDPPADSIAPLEALYLIENRVTELADAVLGLGGGSPTDAVIRAAHYTTLKTGADALTAILVAQGKYHPFRAARTQRFAAGSLLDHAPEFMTGEAMEWVFGCAKALDDPQDSIRSQLPDVLTAAGHTAAALVNAWCALAAREFDRDADAVEDLLLARCEAGRATTHLRQAMLLSRRIGRRQATVIRASITKRAWVIADLLPIAALRVASLLEAIAAGEPDPAVGHSRVHRYLEAITHAFGYREGSVCQRARTMYKDAIR